MPAQLSFDPACTAVLSMDYQTALVSIYAKEQEGLLVRARSVLGRARNLGMVVIHVQVAFRSNFPEISPRNALLSALKTYWATKHTFEGAAGAIHAAVAPEGEDIVVTKHRVNAFTGTDLEMILRAKNIDTLVLFGIATSGVVLSTLLHAADEDYRLVVIKDCCADLNPEVHACLIDKVFPRQAAVVSASEFLDALKSVERPSLR
ncbi:MAG TPA: isochorismatase family cysteine hydrolase [Candidatus Acidoferrales bacterium]|nr:isochorismatase family cysteine hydrolase [Candidatus Acidoferrales bacterium]